MHANLQEGKKLETIVEENLFKRVLHHASTAWIILVCSVALTTLAWFISDHYVFARASDRFQFQIEDIKKVIVERMQEQERALRGGVGLFAASNHVERKEWKAYVDTLVISKNYPGLQGFGYSQVVTPQEKSAHIQQIRNLGFPDYSIRPNGTRDFYTAIIYLEPFDWRNQRAFGYDMFSEPTRREAMERARDTKAVAVSGKVTLVQETEKDVQHGFLMYLPVYARNKELQTIEQRREALVGFVYSPFRMKDLMQGILGARDSDIELEIFDGHTVSVDTLMYDSNQIIHLSETDFQPEFSDTVVLNIGGRAWSLYLNSKQGYVSLAEESQPLIVAMGGAIIDLLLFLIIGSISRQHKIANKLLVATQENVSEQELNTQTIANTVHDGIITIDENGVINFANPAVTNIFGYSNNEIVGQNVKMLMTEADYNQHDNYLKAYQSSGMAQIIGIGREVKGKRRNGSIFPLELAVNSMERNGKRYYVGTLRDVTERHESSRKLLESITQMESRTQEMTLLSGLNDLLQTCHDIQEIYQVIQNVMKQMFNNLSGTLYVASDVDDNLTLACQWNNTGAEELIERKDCLGIRRGGAYTSKDKHPILRCQHFPGHAPLVSLCVPLTSQGVTIGLLSVYSLNESVDAEVELSPQRQELIVALSKQIGIALANLRLRLKLEQQSIHDHLTGLHNRRFLQEMLPKEIRRTLRNSEAKLSILMIDVDHFKKVNDKYGHEVGDRVLYEVASVLSTNTRNEDIVCRYGGEEFAVVLPTMSIEGAINRANILRDKVRKIRIDSNGQAMQPLTISIGIAGLPEHGIDEVTLLRMADQALYEAKSAGRDCVMVSGEDRLDDNVASI